MDPQAEKQRHAGTVQMNNCHWTPQYQHVFLVHSEMQEVPVPVHDSEAGGTAASVAGGVPGIPWHRTPVLWDTELCSMGCAMTQTQTIAWSPGRTCVSDPCLTYPPSTVKTTQSKSYQACTSISCCSPLSVILCSFHMTTHENINMTFFIFLHPVCLQKS